MKHGLAAFLLAMPAFAADVNFVPPANFNWFDPNMWTPVGVPIDGDLCDLEEGNIDFVIDINNAANPGQGVNLPNSTIIIGRGRYVDSSAGGDPSQADDGIVANIVQFNGSGGQAPFLDVPITANEATSNRHGGRFQVAPIFGTIDARGVHQQRWEFNVDVPTVITSITMRDTDSRGNNHDDTFNANANMATEAFDLEWGRISVASGATFDVGDFQITDDVDWGVKNEVILDGNMTARSLTIEMVDADNNVTLAPQPGGTYGSIGSASIVDFNVSWITGDGVLTVGGGEANLAISAISISGNVATLTVIGSDGVDYWCTSSTDGNSFIAENTSLGNSFQTNEGTATFTIDITGDPKLLLRIQDSDPEANF